MRQRNIMPPVHNITLTVLTRCAADNVTARKPRIGINKRSYILKLITKTVSSSRLRKTGTPAHSAVIGLMQQKRPEECVDLAEAAAHAYAAADIASVKYITDSTLSRVVLSKITQKRK